MPRLDTDDEQMERHQIGASFSFTGARISSLGASEYTLATIVLDCTGSLQGRRASFMPMDDATPEAFAKIAGWVSQSVSSTSQALGTGGPSQKIAPVI